MLAGMLLMFVMMAGGWVVAAWMIGRRLIAHLRKNPEAAKAISEHIITPLLGEDKEGVKSIKS
jgi:hypothetical protein